MNLPLCRPRYCVGSSFLLRSCLVHRCRQTPGWTWSRSRYCRCSRPTSRRARWRRRRRGCGAAYVPGVSSRTYMTRWSPRHKRATPRVLLRRSLLRRWTPSHGILQTNECWSNILSTVKQPIVSIYLEACKVIRRKNKYSQLSIHNIDSIHSTVNKIFNKS